MAISNGLLPLTSTQLTFAPLWSKTCALQHWLLMMAWVRAVRPSLSASSRRDPELIRVWMQEVWPPAELSIRHDLPPESLTASDTPCCMRNSTTSLWPEEHAACSAAEGSALLFSLLRMKKLIWKQILIVLGNLSYIVNKNRLKKAQILLKVCEYRPLTVNHCNHNWANVSDFVLKEVEPI